jgi:hypothetical protein
VYLRTVLSGLTVTARIAPSLVIKVSAIPSSSDSSRASDGALIIHLKPARFFEAPISSPLPEGLNYIP